VRSCDGRRIRLRPRVECQRLGAEGRQVGRIGVTIAASGRGRAQGPEEGLVRPRIYLKEPDRIEGKKTRGVRIGGSSWRKKCREVILYPRGGGVGLIGMCKKRRRVEERGWKERTVEPWVAGRKEDARP